MTLSIYGPRDPRMQIWVELMARHADQSSIIFSIASFAWLRQQMITIEEYPYACIYFCGDPDLILPDGTQWGAMGKNVLTMFLILRFLHVFLFFMLSKNKLKILCTEMSVTFDQWVDQSRQQMDQQRGLLREKSFKIWI